MPNTVNVEDIRRSLEERQSELEDRSTRINLYIMELEDLCDDYRELRKKSIFLVLEKEALIIQRELEFLQSLGLLKGEPTQQNDQRLVKG